MNGQVLALLEKSRIFAQKDVEIKVNSLDDFHFWLPNCFYDKEEPKDEKIDRLKYSLKSFIKKYLKSWPEFTDSDLKPFDWEKYASSLLWFFFSVEWDDLFDTLVSGKEKAYLEIAPNNSRLCMKRMGDILVFNVLCLSSDKEHATGIRAVKALCREPDSGNNQGVYELVHNVQVSLPLFYNKTENGGMEGSVFFPNISDKLVEAAPYIKWRIDYPKLVEAYQNIETDGVVVGKYFDLSLYGRLVHENTSKGKEGITHEDFSFTDRARTWRRGNTEKIDALNYRFSECETMRLVLSLKSSLPEHPEFDNVDNLLKAHREQFILANTGAIFLTQMCSMMVNDDQQRSIELGN